MSSKAPQVPQVLRDVYRDLRDRRLLPVAVLLIVAIILVPFLIKGPEPTITAVDVGQVSPPTAASPELEPVVLSDLPTLRDPKKRLKSYLKKNPFEQQPPPSVAAPTGAGLSEGVQSVPTQGDVTPDTGGADASTPTSTPVDPAPSSSPPAADPPASEAPLTPEAPDPVETPKPRVRVEPKLVFYTVDVKAGPVGNARVMENVKSGEFLPNEEHPVAQYLLGEADETSASFAVSPAVLASEGDGKCIPARIRCEFLTLAEGEEQRLTYGADGRIYRIKLIDVVRHERPLPEVQGP